MAEFILGMNLSIYLPILLFVLLIQIISVKKILFAWFDPLSIYMVTSSFGTAFAVYLFIDKEILLEDFMSFLASTSCFFIGMNFGNFSSIKSVKKSRVSVTKQKNVSETTYAGHLYVFVFLSLLILIINNLILISITGNLPLFSADVDIAKVAARGPGLGIIYRINNALLPTSLAIIFSKLFNPFSQLKKNHYIIIYGALIILLFFLVSGGDKGGILTVINILSFLFIANVHAGNNQARIIPKLIIAFFGLGIGLMIMIFIQAAASGNYTSTFDGLFIRFVAAGESFYYFYKFNLIQKISSTPLDYLFDSLNPFLALLKLSEYKEALGSRLITEAIGLDVGKFGTNPQYQIEGAIYFGVIGSFFYSFSIGYSMIFVRNFLLERAIKSPNQLTLATYVFLSSYFTYLPIDSSLLYVTLYSIVIIAMPIFVAISIVLGPHLKRAEELHLKKLDP
jgi:hypothetical protein